MMVKDRAYSNGLDKLNIGVITHPIKLIGGSMLANFLDLLKPISNEIFVITGNFSYENEKVHIIIKMKSIYETNSLLTWAVEQILTQLRASFYLLKISKSIDVVIFYLGARTHLLPMLIAKLEGKKTIVTATGSASKTTKGVYNRFGIGKIVIPLAAGILERICFSLSDQIAVESESAIHFLELGRYKNKIAINGALYMDTNSFKIKKILGNRRNIVGYIGRLSLEKGIMNFVKAIPLISKRRNNIEFLIGGDGQLLDDLKEELKKSNCYNRVKFTGGIPHEEVPEYLNELKLLILPSYSEGVPGIVQEGMACGAIVLATPVGGVPDLIKDGETGFILENNSPDCIADGVIRALECPNLDEIVKNARKLIEKEYAYEAMVKKCRDSLNELMKDK